MSLVYSLENICQIILYSKRTRNLFVNIFASLFFNYAFMFKKCVVCSKPFLECACYRSCVLFIFTVLFMYIFSTCWSYSFVVSFVNYYNQYFGYAFFRIHYPNPALLIFAILHLNARFWYICYVHALFWHCSSCVCRFVDLFALSAARSTGPATI